MIMIKLPLFFLISFLTFAHDHVPAGDEKHVHAHDYQFDLRFFKKINSKINLMFELENIVHEKRNNETQIMAGGKYRVNSHFKIGAYLGSIWGMRHDEDWVKTQSPDWGWRNTSSRDEQFLVLESIWRDNYDLFRMFIGELRLRFFQTFRFDKQTLRIRPKISTTILKDGLAFCTLFIMHERYLPINYSSEDLYAYWTYLGLMFHPQASFDWGPFVSIGQEVWSPDDALIRKTTNDNWKSVEEAVRLGFNLNFYY